MMVHKIPSCAFRARPENSQILFRWMSMATPLPYNIFDLSLFTAKATPFPSMHRSAAKRRPSGKSFWKGGARGGRTFFQKGFPPRKLFFLHIFKRLPAVPKTKKSPAERGQKKTPSRCELQGGLRTIFGSGLLSHMTLCSIIGDGELNFRVRNGVGCTLSSMATKEIW